MLVDHKTNILSVTNLSIAFSNGFAAVKDISFNIAKGKTLAIVGESGSGKSLTALSLMGLLPRQASLDGNMMLIVSGREINLNKITATQWQQMRGKEMGMIFQEPMSSLNPVMKIGKQLAETIEVHNGMSKAEAKLNAVDWLQKVQLPEPAKMYDRYPHQLSGGQKQRVMIAMAMCNNPALLIADEPTTALDVTVQKEVVALMKQLQEERETAMIFITHDLALASEVADDVLVMYRGEVMEYGNIHQVLANPQHPYTKALLACRPAPEKKGKRLVSVADVLGSNDAVKTENTSPARVISEAQILQVNGLKVWFTENRDWLGRPIDYFKAVDDVSFEIKRGEVLGLVGESGCGKSTISRSLMGLLPVHEGQVIFKGEDIAGLPQKEWKRVRRQIQMVFQDPYASLNPRMTVGDMLMEPMKVHQIVPTGELKKEALRLLDLVQLPGDSMNRYPHQFSGGQRQRIGIARALSLKPELMICDESVSALDVSVQAQILNLLKDLQTEFGLTYLFISHDLNVVHYMSDRVLVMQKGHIVERGEASDVLQHPVNDYTKRLIAAMPGR
ncbi:MAG: ABC transporter ATP-binding protein [Bacteroidetes bacterium 43-93]|nr:ABC transporter ATP-binding protein [Bacteroidota bacterium]OJW96909.1 MAG: ABC transporter ATP-binding protein [Bacteroidetes bacterium 43-93]